MKEHLSISKEKLVNLEAGLGEAFEDSGGQPVRNKKNCKSFLEFATLILYVELILVVGWGCYTVWNNYRTPAMEAKLTGIVVENELPTPTESTKNSDLAEKLSNEFGKLEQTLKDMDHAFEMERKIAEKAFDEIEARESEKETFADVNNGDGDTSKQEEPPLVSKEAEDVSQEVSNTSEAKKNSEEVYERKNVLDWNLPLLWTIHDVGTTVADSFNIFESKETEAKIQSTEQSLPQIETTSKDENSNEDPVESSLRSDDETSHDKTKESQSEVLDTSIKEEDNSEVPELNKEKESTFDVSDLYSGWQKYKCTYQSNGMFEKPTCVPLEETKDNDEEEAIASSGESTTKSYFLIELPPLSEMDPFKPRDLFKDYPNSYDPMLAMSDSSDSNEGEGWVPFMEESLNSKETKEEQQPDVTENTKSSEVETKKISEEMIDSEEQYWDEISEFEKRMIMGKMYDIMKEARAENSGEIIEDPYLWMYGSYPYTYSNPYRRMYSSELLDRISRSVAPGHSTNNAIDSRSKLSNDILGYTKPEEVNPDRNVESIESSSSNLMRKNLLEFFTKMEILSAHIDKLHARYLHANELSDDYISQEFPSDSFER